jgi:serine protease AprX
MFAINFRQVLPLILAALLIGCIFPTGTFAQLDKIEQAVLDAARVQETVEVIIRLQERPNREIVSAVKAQFYPNIEATSRQIRDKIRPFRQQGQPLPLNVKGEVRALHEALDNETQQMRKEIYTQIWNRVSAAQGRVREAIENAGGTVYAQVAVTNTVGAELPANVVAQIAGLAEVESIGLETEGQPALAHSVAAINAASFWNAGFDGGNYDVAIVERGVDSDHPDLRSVASGGLIKRNPNDESAHGTQVAGVAASTNTADKGVAFGLDKILDASFERANWGDAINAMEWAVSQASDDAEVLNHSWTWKKDGDYLMNAGDTDWSDMGQDLDEFMDDYDVVVVLAAGNKGSSNFTLVWPNDSYNAISVANVDDQGLTNRNSHVIAASSSRGTTPLGRKKPDLAAPGQGIWTTNLGGGTAHVNGTSFAAPHVAGAILLLWDHGMWHPALLKALLINSAEDKGTAGWDRAWGWGYIDLDTTLDQYDHAMIGSINAFSEKWYSGTMNAGEKATIAWLKHRGQSLVDLDLFLYAPSDLQNSLDSSEHTRDNVEQVQRPSGSGTVYLKVVCWSNPGSQTFGLAPPNSFQSISAPSAPAIASVVDEDNQFALHRNYPNPFNPETWIPYQLASEANVVIRIYNIDGQLVRMLNLGKQPAGNYKTQNKAAFWDGRNNEGSTVASGVYFYTLEADGKTTATYKMVMRK